MLSTIVLPASRHDFDPIRGAHVVQRVMAKCSVCEARKGKRYCRIEDAMVCPACCGMTRDVEACEGCAFYKPPTRAYNALPYYSPPEMDASKRLQEISFPIEAGLCSLDRQLGFQMKDHMAIAIVELLIDMYTFGDSRESLEPRIKMLAAQEIFDLVESELKSYPRDEIAKVLGAVRHVARRRNIGGRHHMDVLQMYCGAFVKTGVGRRVLRDGTELIASGV